MLMYTINVIIRIVLTLFLSVFAAVAANKSLIKSHNGKKRLSLVEHGAIISIGLFLGIISLIFPKTMWPFVVFLIFLIVVQILNNESRWRSTSWSCLSALAGVLLLFAIFANMGGEDGTNRYHVIAGTILALLPIFIGMFKGYYLEKVKDPEGKKEDRNKTIVLLAIFCVAVVVFVITAVVVISNHSK